MRVGVMNSEEKRIGGSEIEVSAASLAVADSSCRSVADHQRGQFEDETRSLIQSDKERHAKE